MKKYLTTEEIWSDFDAFKARESSPDQKVFYDGPMDPLARWAAQEQEKLEAEIAASGGIDAWRKQAAQQTQPA